MMAIATLLMQVRFKTPMAKISAILSVAKWILRFTRTLSGQNLAIDIYITDFKSIKPQSNFLSNLAKPNLTPVSPKIQKIKVKVFVFMAIYVVGSIFAGLTEPFLQSWSSSDRSLGGFFLISALFAYFIACSLLYSAMESLWKKAKSAILRDNLIAYLATLFFGSISVFIMVFIASGEVERNYGKAILVLLCLIGWIGCLIYNIYLRYQIYKEVAYITNQPLFIVAFWCIITIFLSPIGFVLYIIAWIGVREIQQSTSADEYDKTEPKNEMQDYDNQAIVSENSNDYSYQPQITETQKVAEIAIDSTESSKTIESDAINDNEKIDWLVILKLIVAILVFLLVELIVIAIKNTNN